MHQLEEDQLLEAEVADEVLKWEWEEAGQDHEGPCVGGWWRPVRLLRWEGGEVEEGRGSSQMTGVNANLDETDVIVNENCNY